MNIRISKPLVFLIVFVSLIFFAVIFVKTVAIKLLILFSILFPPVTLFFLIAIINDKLNRKHTGLFALLLFYFSLSCLWISINIKIMLLFSFLFLLLSITCVAHGIQKRTLPLFSLILVLLTFACFCLIVNDHLVSFCLVLELIILAQMLRKRAIKQAKTTKRQQWNYNNLPKNRALREKNEKKKWFKK